jgi:hypothetical protein
MQMKIINILMNKLREEIKSIGERMNAILQSDVEILKLDRFLIVQFSSTKISLSRLNIFINSFPYNR